MTACLCSSPVFSHLVCQQHPSFASAFLSSFTTCWNFYLHHGRLLRDQHSSCSRTAALPGSDVPSVRITPWKIGTITPCVRPAGRSMTHLAGTSSPALSALSGPRIRDSVSWRHRASLPDKEVLRFFLPPPPTRAYLHSLLCSR